MKSTQLNLSHASECKCIAWRPIFAGALVIIGFSFLLNLFSVAIGLTAFNTNSDGAETLALGGLIATSLGIVVSMFAAGWLTGYLGQRDCNKRHLGSLYGFLAWCVALILSIFLASHAQQYISFYGHFLSGSSNITAAAANGAAGISANVSNHAVVVSTYIIFMLFFLSAFACSFGGHCGMRHACKDETH